MIKIYLLVALLPAFASFWMLKERLWIEAAEHITCFGLEWWSVFELDPTCYCCKTEVSWHKSVEYFKSAHDAFLQQFQCPCVREAFDLPSSWGVILLLHSEREIFDLCFAWPDGAPVNPWLRLNRQYLCCQKKLLPVDGEVWNVWMGCVIDFAWRKC